MPPPESDISMQVDNNQNLGGGDPHDLKQVKVSNDGRFVIPCENEGI